MTRSYFRIEVKINPGKEMRMPYDKRVIEFPLHHAPKKIETYPLGHYRAPILDKTREIAVAIRTLVLAYMRGNKGFESVICSFIFPLYSAYDHLFTQLSNNCIRVSLVNDN